MAKIEIVTLTDSFDPRVSNGVETVTFFHPVFGTKHEIELGEANQKHLASHLEKLQKYIDASREVTPEPVKAVKTAGAKSDLTVVREWAKENGYTVGDRGRIKAEILDAFDKAQAVNTIAPESTDESHSIVDASDLVEVEFPQDDEPTAEQDTDFRELSDAEILALMDKADNDGEVTLDKLTELATKA